jgi:MarR family transcriptional regulator, transcriptional regulator for hemolysin
LGHRSEPSSGDVAAGKGDGSVEAPQERVHGHLGFQFQGIDIKRFDIYTSAVGPPQAEPIGLALARTAKAVSRDFDEALARAGGSLPVWLVLVSLKARRHRAQRDLAEAVGVEGPTLTHHLNRMERDGLVTRTRDPQNRRVHQVELTPAGEAMFQRLLGRVAAFDRQLRDGFTEEELAHLRSQLARLYANVTAPPKAK